MGKKEKQEDQSDYETNLDPWCRLKLYLVLIFSVIVNQETLAVKGEKGEAERQVRFVRLVFDLFE